MAESEVKDKSVITANPKGFQKPHIVYLDLLRIIAIILVLFNHTGDNGFTYFAVARGSLFYPVSLFISLLDKIAVPLFFMISGALLIPKEESYKEVIKRFVKFALILVAASGIIYVYRYLKGLPSIFTVAEFVTALYSKGIIIQYWYLYTYLAFILMLPFIRKIAKGMEGKDFIWLIALMTINSLLQIADYTVFKGKYFHNSHFSFFISVNYLLYPILGYYLEHKVSRDRYNWKMLLILTGCSVLILAALTVLANLRCTSLQSWKEEDIPYYGCFEFLPTATVFIAAKMFFIRFPAKQRAQKVLSAIAGTTFGLYLFESIFRTESGFILTAMKTVIHPYIACWLWMLIVWMIGGGIIFLIRLIPGVKKLI